ncbi:MAG TPA: EamA family transporter [Anaerolineales bacterium]|nr:EamA family transporter [Anaerolineales bacterium]
MFKGPSSHRTAVLQALLVTLLWSTSWVLIKFGLAEIPALTFAGLRYSLAFLVLLPISMRRESRSALSRLSGKGWARLLLLGLLYYTLTQGALFVSLAYLPAVTVSLLLNLSPVVVALLGLMFLNERPGWGQWAGVALSIAGTLVYFSPAASPAGRLLGLAAALVGLLSNSLATVLGRQANRSGDLPPLAVTVVSMGFGSFLMLGTSLALEGLPRLSLQSWGIIAWLAVVNTAFAFTLWNHTLRTLPAVESSVINNTMLIQIAVLAWLFLGERLTRQAILGMAVAGAGALVVQLRRARSGTARG